MISIDFDKLEYVCKVLVSFEDMLRDCLNRTRRASDDIRFTPMEMVKCPSIGRMQDDMRNTQQKGKITLDNIEALLRFIRYAMYKYKEADSKIAREIATINVII